MTTLLCYIIFTFAILLKIFFMLAPLAIIAAIIHFVYYYKLEQPIMKANNEIPIENVKFEPRNLIREEKLYDSTI